MQIHCAEGAEACQDEMDRNERQYQEHRDGHLRCFESEVNKPSSTYGPCRASYTDAQEVAIREKSSGKSKRLPLEVLSVAKPIEEVGIELQDRLLLAPLEWLSSLRMALLQ